MSLCHDVMLRTRMQKVTSIQTAPSDNTTTHVLRCASVCVQKVFGLREDARRRGSDGGSEDESDGICGGQKRMSATNERCMSSAGM